MKILQQTCLISCLFAALIAGCSKETDDSQKPRPEAPPADDNSPGEEPPKDNTVTPPAIARKSPEIIAFMKSEPAPQQEVRKDEGQLLLYNKAGEIAIAGVTRSSLDRPQAIEPGLGGDLFYTKYRVNEGWSEAPVQVAVVAPLPPPPEDPETPTPGPQPLPDPLVKVKGGRLFESGNAVIVGELKATHINEFQLNLPETTKEDQSLFMAVFSANQNGMIKSLRYGLAGSNTIAGAAASDDEAGIFIGGMTTTGLLDDRPGRISTKTSSASNYLAELNADGDITRFFSWPMAVTGEVKDQVVGLASLPGMALTATERDGAKGVFLKSFRALSRRPEFIDLPEIQVCKDATDLATSVKFAGMAAKDHEVVVAIEVYNQSTSPGTVFPCFEVFEVKQTGSLVRKRESVFLDDDPTVAGTTRVSFVANNQILLARTRPDVGPNGSNGLISTFVYQRPVAPSNYRPSKFALSRPDDWYENKSVTGLYRKVNSIVWPEGSPYEDVVWILSNDQTFIPDQDDPNQKHLESIVNLGSYRTAGNED